MELDWSTKMKDMSVLEQHVAWFDQDRDSVIWPLDTYHGFRLLGFNIIYSFFAMLL